MPELAVVLRGEEAALQMNAPQHERFTPDKIVVLDRLRAIDEEALEAMMESIQVLGQQTPISVRYVGTTLVLVAGRHRLEACRRLGLPSVDCKIFAGTEAEARLWEIAENLHRADLTALQRFEHIAEWLRLTEDKLQSAQVAPVESAREDGRGHRPQGGINAAVRELGIERTAAQRAVKVAGLSDEVKAAACDAGLDDNQSALRAVAAEPTPEAQVAKILEIAERGAVRPNTAAASPESSVETGRRHPVQLYTGNNEWFTPPPVMDAVREVLGAIDLDPASNDVAQKTVRATTYYSIEDDGLEKDWRGKVWMNPPYSADKIGPFMRKLTEHVLAGDVTEAITLTDNRTDTVWFHDAAIVASRACFTKRRVGFLRSDGESPGSPTNGQVFFYFGDRPDAFADVFSNIGWVVRGH